MEKVECKKYPKAVWNSMSRKQQMQVRKLHEHQGIKPTTKQIGTEARIAAHESQLGIDSQPKKVMLSKRERLLKNHHLGEIEGQ